jgi:hypothetical protein
MTFSPLGLDWLRQITTATNIAIRAIKAKIMVLLRFFGLDMMCG